MPGPEQHVVKTRNTLIPADTCIEAVLLTAQRTNPISLDQLSYCIPVLLSIWVSSICCLCVAPGEDGDKKLASIRDSHKRSYFEQEVRVQGGQQHIELQIGACISTGVLLLMCTNGCGVAPVLVCIVPCEVLQQCDAAWR